MPKWECFVVNEMFIFSTTRQKDLYEIVIKCKQCSFVDNQVIAL